MAAGEGLIRIFGELGAHVVPGGETLNPSTYELLAGIHEVPAEEVIVLPSSSNVTMAAERACELSEKPAWVLATTSQQASLLALVELDSGASAEQNADATQRQRSPESQAAGLRPRPAMTPRVASVEGDAVGFVGTARSSPGVAPVRPLPRRSPTSPRGLRSSP